MTRCWFRFAFWKSLTAKAFGILLLVLALTLVLVTLVYIAIAAFVLSVLRRLF
jgi:hypothetical protein